MGIRTLIVLGDRIGWPLPPPPREQIIISIIKRFESRYKLLY